MTKQLTPLNPSAAPATWLGVMGGGQLGRMFAHAAQQMGFKVAVLEPALDCPASHAADQLHSADYTDVDALAKLAAQCVAVTTEFENVSAKSLAFLAERTFVAPSSSCVSIAQDRMAEKRFFIECATTSGVFPASHKEINSDADVDAVSDDLLPGILKTVRMGYDGKGQVRVKTRAELHNAYANMNGVACVLEKMLPLAYEISVLAARGADGRAVVYPIAENVHRDGILFTTTVPGPNISKESAEKAQAATLAVIEQLGYVGVLCIEFFVLTDGSLVVNEMAPRPHNSGHYTIDACVTSQFAQQARAMARMPLGDVRQHSPAAMLNILGDIWFEGKSDEAREPAWDKVLALPGANLHLYGKDTARRARKMGHITFVAATLEEAQANLRKACDILGIAP
ncbi:5-(carboxyamino)imidazole ribonucleotide synthase [Herminiimonas fonticola]|uniref:N5-carboxyaminoimidazole ribonucleotide synthase n=1 Tax=Herminiimonas fonticola TaxID=303380 RepID=A0A4R6GJ14_9BURK|nr:5-(carboxyamino)imidazole ribonucleotide synthase [Herminiimonas fonticola]RBA25305.1 purK: phosphoribosylaminoimidazole carboxylase, ATPase subunit [Herminiimonas fonticola]TDN94420.1 5-(carboxyamino)imidazole ribonucleotide synthase [Herminiimonas fonticola]